MKNITKRFPEWQERLERLMKVDADFRKLCEEYEEIDKTLKFWFRLAKLPGKQIERQIAENQELLQELETQILLTLKKNNSSEEESPGDSAKPS